MRYLPGQTVQCLNPECMARGQWMRLHDTPQESCVVCGSPLHGVPHPLQPRPKLRPRVASAYRPLRPR